ncbi:MAG: ammonium transporter [Zoogloeaceae bacterium]|jgi:Amt family ammonium transporter|nr:ammonium transporter [Zoogloeaceae bacterium]
MKKTLFAIFALCFGLCFSGMAFAEPVSLDVSSAVNIEASVAALAAEPVEPAAEVLDTGTTAWMMTSAALVVMMCIPGLAMFYAGMVNAKNVLSVFSQFFATAGVVCVLWVVFGYSIATDTTGMEKGVFNLHSFFGGTGALFLAHLKPDNIVGGMPESVLITFLMTFAIITPAIVAGGFAERMKFVSAVLFMALWFTFVYAPVSHMVWGGDGSLMANWGVLDFAGGTAVHINSGIAALAACLVIGKRKGYLQHPMPPHNLTICLIGAGFVWIGWFGFNVGSAVAVNGTTGMALLNTQIGACAGVLGWMIVEWLRNGRPSALGLASGALAGLVGITPGCAYVGPIGAIMIGLASGAICFFFVSVVKRRFGYDDTLDVFGLHGVGGMVGAILTGIFCVPALGGTEDVQIATQIIAQFKGVIFTIVYCFVISWILLKLIDKTIGLRVDAETETVGLDQSEHSEKAYNL